MMICVFHQYFLMIGSIKLYHQSHVYEDKNSLILKFDMPGLIKDDIEIDFADKFLTISGTRSHNNIDKIANIHQEVDYGEFHRTLDLSNYHLKDDISAEYENGILE